MKKILMLLICFSILIVPISSASESHQIGNSGNWSNFTYSANITTNPYNLVPAYSADFFNRVNNTNINTNTGKTKWFEDASGLQIINNAMAREAYYGTANDLNTSGLSNYNITFKLSSVDGTDKRYVIYFYTNRTDFDESSSTNCNGKAYRIYIQAGVGDIKYSYVDNTRTDLDNFYGANDAINYNDVITIDTSTVATGLKIYRNGVLLDTFVGNSSLNSGGATIGSYSNLDFAIDDYSASFTNQENITSNNQTLSSNLTAIKLNIESGTMASVWVNTSSDNITWTGNILVKENAEDNVEYAVNSSNNQQNVITTIQLKTINDVKTELSSVYLITGELIVAPLITSSSPSTPTTSFVNESKTFNAGSDQIGNWTWYMDSVQVKNTETNTANATYTNSTAPNGTTYNVTASITNTNGSAQISWDWTPLQNYVTTNVTYFNRDNISINLIFNVSYVSPGTQQWGYNYSATDAGNTYNWTYQNNTVIQSLIVTILNETLEFMQPTLPTGIYYIQETEGAVTSTMTIPVNSWGMFNNWTSTMTFAGIAANESNDICYTYYNVTSGLWESYYVGYSWNADYQLSKNASVIGYFDAQTNITSSIITPSSTELYTGWNMVALQGSSNKTISEIIADI